jgi:DNA-binding NarL/FixJ family response regulator
LAGRDPGPRPNERPAHRRGVTRRPEAVAPQAPRERETLELIAAGHQNREIATQLGIRARTVEVHKARIMEKLECRSLAELMRANRALS